MPQKGVPQPIKMFSLTLYTLGPSFSLVEPGLFACGWRKTTARSGPTSQKERTQHLFYAHCLIKATPTIVGEAFIFYLWTFFLPRTYIAERRRSGAPSKVYQWLGPRCRQKVTRKNFANRPLIFTGGEKVRNLASILKISRLWRALVSKRGNTSEI